MWGFCRAWAAPEPACPRRPRCRVPAGLHPEQLALVDFLVMMRAQRVVGLGGSSFSYLLRELRALHRRPKATSYLLYPPGMDVVMSKDFFGRAAVLS